MGNMEEYRGSMVVQRESYLHPIAWHFNKNFGFRCAGMKYLVFN